MLSHSAEKALALILPHVLDDISHELTDTGQRFGLGRREMRRGTELPYRPPTYSLTSAR